MAPSLRPVTKRLASAGASPTSWANSATSASLGSIHWLTDVSHVDAMRQEARMRFVTSTQDAANANQVWPDCSVTSVQRITMGSVTMGARVSSGEIYSN